MPAGDRTGPEGYGPQTGRAMGYCSGSNIPGYAQGGYGRGMGYARGGYGRGMGYARGGYGRGFGFFGRIFRGRGFALGRRGRWW